MVNNFLFSSNKRSKNNSAKSQRQLKVGEELRHLISNALLRNSFYDENIENYNITITEVNVSPDLKNAKVYVMPLGGENKLNILNSLNKATGRLKKLYQIILAYDKHQSLYLRLMTHLSMQKKLMTYFVK